MFIFHLFGIVGGGGAVVVVAAGIMITEVLTPFLDQSPKRRDQEPAIAIIETLQLPAIISENLYWVVKGKYNQSEVDNNSLINVSHAAPVGQNLGTSL